MANNSEFPSLNDETKPIFEEFSRIYREDVLENGRQKVAAICAQYNAAQKEIGQEKSSPQLEK
jgi:hypothetical protein